MLCPFSPFHCPPVAQAKSQMPSQQWENMGFQGASAIVLNMVGRAHYETEWERQGLWMMEGCTTPHLAFP